MTGKTQRQKVALIHTPHGFAGCDEAGRGPLIGDVVAAAVLFHGQPPEGIRDSKKCSAKERADLFAAIRACAHVGIGHATAEEIDALNIHHATLLAMKRAIDALQCDILGVIVDGKFTPPCAVTALAEPKADDRYLEVAAASIIAKHRRDDMMRDLDRQFPQYGFAQHKGYPTKAHREAIQTFGALPQHRQSFRGVKMS